MIEAPPVLRACRLSAADPARGLPHDRHQATAAMCARNWPRRGSRCWISPRPRSPLTARPPRPFATKTPTTTSMRTPTMAALFCSLCWIGSRRRRTSATQDNPRRGKDATSPDRGRATSPFGRSAWDNGDSTPAQTSTHADAKSRLGTGRAGEPARGKMDGKIAAPRVPGKIAITRGT